MKILLLTRWYYVDANNGNMINDLAEMLQAQGNDVCVLCVEWKGQETTGHYEVNGVRVWWYSESRGEGLPPRLKKLYKMLLGSYGAKRKFGSEIEAFSPDAVVAMSFTAFYSGLLSHFKKNIKSRIFLILWDFFPFHHFNIRGVDNKVMTRLAIWWESRQLKLCDYIGLMTPRNMDYFRLAYPAVRNPPLVILPIWGPPPESHMVDRNLLRSEFDLPADRVIAVFGGTLSRGRGIAEILDLVKEVQTELPQAYFVIIGDGPLRPEIEGFIANNNLDNIICLKRLARADYQRFVAACDIGIVATASNMPLIAPFPSKSIDYIRNHLAILASVEPTTDYADILENEIKGGLASHAGDLQAFKANLKKLVENPQLRREMAENSTRYFEKNLDVARVAKRIIDQLGEGACAKKSTGTTRR